MKTIIAFAALVAAAIAASQESDVITVREIPSSNIGLGDYAFGYVLSNGATRDEIAKTVDDSLVVAGSYSWIDPKTNEPILTKYIADKHGFRAEGAHIPV